METDLEKKLEGSGTVGNLTIDEVLGAVVDTKIIPLFATPLIFYYAFFSKPEKSSILIPLGSCIYLPLRLEKYGIADFIESRGKTMNEILEEVGAEVNDAMEYDFDKIEGQLAEDIENLTKQGGSHNNSIAMALTNQLNSIKSMRGRYQPTGNEVTKGICADAGKMIRDGLYSLGLNERYGILLVSSNNGETYHDTTLVFNKETGHWVVVNSKSPVKLYNLVPKDRLRELGSPYMPFEL